MKCQPGHDASQWARQPRQARWPRRPGGERLAVCILSLFFRDWLEVRGGGGEPRACCGHKSTCHADIEGEEKTTRDSVSSVAVDVQLSRLALVACVDRMRGAGLMNLSQPVKRKLHLWRPVFPQGPLVQVHKTGRFCG